MTPDTPPVDTPPISGLIILALGLWCAFAAWRWLLRRAAERNVPFGRAVAGCFAMSVFGFPIVAVGMALGVIRLSRFSQRWAVDIKQIRGLRRQAVAASMPPAYPPTVLGALQERGYGLPAPTPAPAMAANAAQGPAQAPMVLPAMAPLPVGVNPLTGAWGTMVHCPGGAVAFVEFTPPAPAAGDML